MHLPQALVDIGLVLKDVRRPDRIKLCVEFEGVVVANQDAARWTVARSASVIDGRTEIDGGDDLAVLLEHARVRAGTAAHVEHGFERAGVEEFLQAGTGAQILELRANDVLVRGHQVDSRPGDKRR